jgi:hypothetical protein
MEGIHMSREINGDVPLENAVIEHVGGADEDDTAPQL